MQEYESEIKQLAPWADIMDNISKQTELEHAEREFIEHLKQTQCKTKSMIEYKNLNIAIFDQTMFICYSGIKEYYPLALKLLVKFKNNLSDIINQECRYALVRYQWENPENDKGINILERIAKRQVSDNKIKVEENIVKAIELCSKILQSFNGELNVAVNARIDLILLRKITNYYDEIRFIHLITKKFKRSSIAWYYRKLVYSLLLNERINSFNAALALNRNEVKKRDKTEYENLFKGLSSLWKQEDSDLLDIANRFSRSYYLWSYIHFVYEKSFRRVRKVIDGLNELDKSSLEIFFIEQVFEAFETWKSWSQKNIYNGSGLDFLYKLIELITQLGVEKFMGDFQFNSSFQDDHLKWITDLIKFYTDMQKDKTEDEKWKSLVMVDYQSLEAAKNHAEAIKKQKDSLKKW